MGPKAHSAIMFFNSVTRAMETNAVAEFFTTCTTGRQSSKAVVPTATFQERVDVQLCKFGGQITQVKPGVDSHATHAHADQAAGPRGCGRGDHGGEQGGWELCHGVQLD